MTAFKCDICGKYYGGYYNGIIDDHQCNAIGVSFRGEAGHIRESNMYDICPDCLTAFAQFLYDRRHPVKKKVLDQEGWRGE